MPPAGLSTQKKCQIGTPQLLAYFFICFCTFKIFKHHEVAITVYHKTRMIKQQSN